MLDSLKYAAWQANRRLDKLGLAELGEGAVSVMDRDKGIFAIKPDKLPFDELTPERFSLIDLNGNLLEGDTPAADYTTHLALYKSFPEITAVARVFGYATQSFASARRPVPVFSELHAKHFSGDIPVTRLLSEKETGNDFGLNTGKSIADVFKTRSYLTTAAVIVSSGASYAWGETAEAAVMNGAYLEASARIALGALGLSGGISPMPPELQNAYWCR